MPIFTYLPFAICDGEILTAFHGIRDGAEPDLPISAGADLVDSDPISPGHVISAPVVWVK